MKLIAEKYRTLKPTVELLSDEVIIAQAWKKSHAYIRTHNWYADTLALDISALGLESNASSWADGIRSQSEKLYPLELIPAAKSDKWVVDAEEGWLPSSLLDKKTKKDREKKPPLRPLAHLTIRDQTWATTLMLCLADAVETAQGDCSEKDYIKAKKKAVYSYGNRLLCDWKDGKKAWFRWGNGETYRKFFTDYQSFLKRPVAIGRSVVSNQDDEDNVYIISLDLSKFYDHIDRNLLVQRLKDISSFYSDIEPTAEFWQCAEKVTRWEWDDDSKKLADSLGIELGNGLPQGLVAAGFFANAYLIEFDKAIGRQIGKTIPGSSGINLHDYCRYVDDLRLVVSLENDLDLAEIANKVNRWVDKKLKKFGGDKLTLNDKKTQITALSDLDNSGSLSERVANLQKEISGPADRDVLESSMGVLEGLLTLQTDGMPEVTANKVDTALLRLAKFDHDVRPDTLKRFAANRLESVMRNKRKINVTDSLVDEGNVESIDNESELLAKKLIWAWMQDPSLALVLRKALEIYPSPIIAEPVFESIFIRCSAGDNKDPIITATADYLLADLFRSCVDFHGYFQRIDYPDSSDPTALLALATRYAQKAISYPQLPVFIERQALLLLAVMQKTVTTSNDQASIQNTLHDILSGAPIALKRQNMALYEIAAQITDDFDTSAALLLEHIEKSTEESKDKILEEFAKRGGLFWFSLWKQLKKDKFYKNYINEYRWASPVIGGELSINKQRLSKLTASNDNGFIHEAGVIKLGLALIDGYQTGGLSTGLSPRQLKISQKKGSRKKWSEIWDQHVLLKCESSDIDGNDPRFIIPDWIDAENSDAKVVYWVGMILRTTVIGANDFTGSRWKKSKTHGYKGLRTGWYKRRMGMMHAPETLVGDFATLSDWAAELLMTCLQWPGFESTYLQHDDLKKITGLSSLKKVLTKRLKLLNKLFCEASDMPALITKVNRPKTETKPKFRLVTVQQLLPKTTDFSKADPKLDNPHIKSKNRNHLARICQLTWKTLNAKLQAEGNSGACADLIVFPEIGVHPDDLDLLKRLADKTQSIIFAGLVFKDHEGKLVNVARWLIPDYRDSGRQWVVRDQGKKFLTSDEDKLGIDSYRPCQHLIEIVGPEDGPFIITGSICYDATDLKLASDLKNKTDLYVVVAHNKDVTTFDTMASALHYHMYQHVVLVNKGEFGGSTIQAPYAEQFHRLISHTHGQEQISINVADLDLAAFKRSKNTKYKAVKTKPAGN